jgi:cholest-4-en-3-one 26-monooxygenase
MSPRAARSYLRGYDFTDPDVLLNGIPATEFAELRKTAPVWWIAHRKGAVMRLPDGVTADQLDLTKALLINQEAPEHTRLRKIVSRLFTPRAIATLEQKLAVAARDLVRTAVERNFGKFVDDIAMPLPLQAIVDLIRVGPQLARRAPPALETTSSPGRSRRTSMAR